MFLNKISNTFCVLDTKLVSVALTGKRKNICVGNSVCTTMCPRLPGPLRFLICVSHRLESDSMSDRDF